MDETEVEEIAAQLPSWATWSLRSKYLPEDLHDEENFAAALKKLHMDPESYLAFELTILGILKLWMLNCLLIHFIRNWTLPA